MNKDKLKPKLFSVMKGYNGKQFAKDVVSGIIVAIIALPLSIALALASGVSPEQGIYTAIIAGFLISFLGGSRVQIAGPTAAFATIVAGIVARNGMDGLITATLIAGILMILMGVLRLGNLIRFIPYTITTGFTAGIALTIFIGQIKDFLGITYAAGVKPIEAIEKMEANFEFIDTLSPQALLVGGVCLLILIVYPKFEKRVPPSLIAVVVGVLMVQFIPGLNEGVFTIGELYTIPAGLPKISFSGMDFSLAKITAVLPDAFTIAILGAIESLLSAAVADGAIGDRHDSNTELVAQGVANVVTPLFGGIPATGAIARTMTNINNGGRTPIAGIIHAIVLVLILLVLMPYAKFIPMATLAAVLLIVSYNMSEWRTIKRLMKDPKSDVTVLLVTFFLTVIFDLTIAIEIGLVIACVLFIKRVMETTEISVIENEIHPNEETEECLSIPEGCAVYEINGPYFFGIANKFEELESVLKAGSRPKVQIIRMRRVPFIDSTGIHNLTTLVETNNEKGTEVILSGVTPKVQKQLLKAKFHKVLGSKNFCNNIDEALQRAKELLDK